MQFIAIQVRGVLFFLPTEGGAKGRGGFDVEITRFVFIYVEKRNQDIKKTVRTDHQFICYRALNHTRFPCLDDVIHGQNFT